MANLSNATILSQAGGDAARPSGETYLTERQFSDRYHVAPRTLQRWRVTGDGPRFVRLGVRRIAYRLSDAEAWAGQHVYASRADELSRLAAA